MTKLQLDIVTQEKRLLTVATSRVTTETASGEITILPGHIPLLTRLPEGLLHYEGEHGEVETVVIFGGFLELDSEGHLSVLADSAIRAEDIDLAKAQNAKVEAEQKLKDRGREVEFALAEASLKRTYLELRASKYKKHSN